MTVQTLRVRAPYALMGLLAVFIGVTFPTCNVGAKDCFSAPNCPARQGTVWSSRVGQSTQKKCWFMRTLDPSAQRSVTIRQDLSATAPAIPVPRPRPPVAGPALASSQVAPDPLSSSPDDAVPIPTPRPPVAEPASSSPQVDPGPSAPDDEVEAHPLINGSIVEIRSPRLSDAPLPEDIGSRNAAAPDAPSQTSTTTDKASSAAIEELQPAPSVPGDTKPAPDVEKPALAGAETEVLNPTTPVTKATPPAPNPVSDRSAPEFDAARPIDRTSDKPASSMSRDVVEPRTTSSSFPPKSADDDASVSVIERLEQPAAAPVPTQFGWPTWLPQDHAMWNRALIYSALKEVNPLYLILALVIATVMMSYYLIYKSFQWSTTISDPWPDDLDTDRGNKDPEFYRKLRQAPVKQNF